jgi:hypothetical protein
MENQAREMTGKEKIAYAEARIAASVADIKASCRAIKEVFQKVIEIQK